MCTGFYLVSQHPACMYYQIVDLFQSVVCPAMLLLYSSRVHLSTLCCVFLLQYPWDVVRKAWELGLMNGSVPPEYGEWGREGEGEENVGEEEEGKVEDACKDGVRREWVFCCANSWVFVFKCPSVRLPTLELICMCLHVHVYVCVCVRVQLNLQIIPLIQCTCTCNV